MKPSNAIMFLATMQRTEHNDIFEAIVILAKTIVREGIQYDIDNEFEVEIKP